MQANESERTIVLTAFFASLVLHAAGLGMAWQLQDRVEPAMTYLVSESPEEDSAPSDPLPVDEDDEFKPGIENGAPAVVAWIGYEEYQEHLARHAEIDQAAFTMSDGAPVVGSEDQSIPDDPKLAPAPASASVPPPDGLAIGEEPGEGEQERDLFASSDEVVEPEVASKNVSTPIANVHDPMVEKWLEARSLEVSRLLQLLAQAATESNLTSGEASGGAPSDEPADQAEPVASESVADTQEANANANAENAARKPGEPHDRDAVPDEKESDATSTRKVAEAEWNSGQPLAVEGMEILPFALYRHIVVDSGDTFFDFRWSRRVRRNPIVGLQFDRTGRVARVELMRTSGYEELDTKYLASWMSRWRARDKRLAQLEPDDMTNQLLMRIVFIEEPEDQPSEKSPSNDSGS